MQNKLIKVIKHLPGDHKISQDFSLSESACKCCGTSIIDNDQIKLVQAVRNFFNKPTRVTSWNRCEDYNKKVGGYKYSKHMIGKATDLHAPKGSYNEEDLLDICFNNGAKEVGIYPTFVHVSVESTSTKINYNKNGNTGRVFYVD